MEETTTSPGDSTTTPVEQVELDGKPVAFESYKKAVAAEKNAKERARQLEEELNVFKNQELERQGKHEELIAQLKKELNETKTAYQKKTEEFLWDKVQSAISTEALKQGCTDPKKLIKLLDDSDFTMLKVDNGQVESEALSQLMEKAKKENGFLFKQPAVKINDTTPLKPDTKIEPKTDADKIALMKASFKNVLKA